MTQTNINVLLIDDHPLFRRGLSFLLSQEYQLNIVGEAADGAQGILMAQTHAPDIVLLDLDMPKMNGIEILHVLQQTCPTLPVLMLTVAEDAEKMQQCLQLGAKGYVLKNTETDFLRRAIDAVLAGQIVISDEMRRRAEYATQQSQSDANNPSALTAREQQVLRLIANGFSNKTIAQELAVSENTVKVYVQKILRKLGMHSRVQAAVWAKAYYEPNSH